MKRGQMVTYLLKLFLFSFLISTSSAINVTHERWEDVTEFLSDLNAEKPKPYAIKMYDSVGKYSSNILNGNVDRLGSYTECISAEAPSGKFHGQYCKLQLQQGRIDYYNGICVPDSYQEEEITALATLDTFKFKSTSFLLPFPSLFALNATISFSSVARCAKDLSTIDAFIGVCLFISVLFIILPIAGTIYSADLWRKTKNNEQLSDVNYGSPSFMQKHTTTSKTEKTQTHRPRPTQTILLHQKQRRHRPTNPYQVVKLFDAHPWCLVLSELGVFPADVSLPKLGISTSDDTPSSESILN